MGMEEQWLVTLKRDMISQKTIRTSDHSDCAIPSVSTSMSKCVELEAVLGCVGGTGKGLCHFTESGEAVFPAAHACVLVSSNGQEQRLFQQHSQEVIES